MHSTRSVVCCPSGNEETQFAKKEMISQSVLMMQLKYIIGVGGGKEIRFNLSAHNGSLEPSLAGARTGVHDKFRHR